MSEDDRTQPLPGESADGQPVEPPQYPPQAANPTTPYPPGATPYPPGAGPYPPGAGPYPPGAAAPYAYQVPAQRRADHVLPRWWGWMLAAAIVVVLIVSGGTAWVVGTVIADTASSHRVVVAPPGHLGQHRMGGGNAAKLHERTVLRGTIASMASNSWTIHTAAGRTVRISITSATVFGTKKHPQAEAQFAVGDRVLALVERTRQSGDWTATRIAAPAAASGSRTPAPTS